MINKKTTLYYIFTISFLVFSLSFFFVSHAQTSDNNLVLTWEAQNFYPSNYEGKALTTKGARVLVSAMGIVNNQIVDLSDAEFLWYLDGKLFKNQAGAQEIIFEASKSPKDTHFVRVLVTDDSGSFTGTTNIQIEKPLSVIELPVFSRTINQNDSITLTSTPYFFNINSLSSLSFFWEINGAVQEKKDRSIEISLDNEYVNSGRNIIRSIINNKSNILESSRSTEQINIR